MGVQALMRRMAVILSLRRRPGSSGSSGPAGDDLEAVKTAFDVAVPERRPPRWLEADQLREPRVAGQEARRPAGEALLQRVAEARIERRQRARRRRGARRTADWRRARRRAPVRGASSDIGARSIVEPRLPRPRLRRCRGIARARADRRRWRRSAGAAGAGRTRSRARWRMRCHVGPSNHASFWKPNVRASPGARSAARAAASIAIVPLPHIGSRNGVPGAQPESATTPAARFSRSGAASASRRQPRLNSGSPDVSR